MNRRLFQQRTIWWPTLPGWCLLLCAPATLIAVWIFVGETWLSVTRRVPAQILVVEGWIHTEGMPVAKREFEIGGYIYLVVTGGPAGPSWSAERVNLAEHGKAELRRLGFPEDRLLSAPCGDSESQRTYESALTAKRFLGAKGLHPQGINVLSRGPHSRRTQMVYSKVFGPSVNIGIVAWRPYASQHLAWWQSSERTKEFLNESIGFFYEWMIDAGRPGGARRLAIPLAFVLGAASVVYTRRRKVRLQAIHRSSLVSLSTRPESKTAAK